MIGEICDAIRAHYPSIAIAKIPNERQPVPPKTKLGAPDIFAATPSESVFLAVVLSGVLTNEQRMAHNELRQLDRKVVVVSSVGEALKVVDQIAPHNIAVMVNESMSESLDQLEGHK